MDFITSIPLSYGCSKIMVIVDRLSKFAHFIVLPNYFSAKLVIDLFIQQIVKIHGGPQSIISDLNKLFRNKFWQHLFWK